MLAEAKGVTAARLALAKVLAHGDDVVPVPGTRRLPFVEENVAAVAMRLTETELATLTCAVTPDAVVGTRYVDMSPVNR